MITSVCPCVYARSASEFERQVLLGELGNHAQNPEHTMTTARHDYVYELSMHGHDVPFVDTLHRNEPSAGGLEASIAVVGPISRPQEGMVFSHTGLIPIASPLPRYPTETYVVMPSVVFGSNLGDDLPNQIRYTMAGSGQTAGLGRSVSFTKPSHEPVVGPMMDRSRACQIRNCSPRDWRLYRRLDGNGQ
jgi:hypothetical protein